MPASVALVQDPTLVRIRCAVDPSYVERIRGSAGEDGQKQLIRDVRRRVEHLYGCSTLVGVQDPTDGAVVVIAQDPSRIPDDRDPVVRPISAERVDAAHVRSPARGDEQKRWDPGLTAPEAWAIERAISVEDEPNHLRGFATTLEPFFPVAASALRRRSVEVERTRPGYRSDPVRAAIVPRYSIPALRQSVLALSSREGIRPELLEIEAQRVACIIVEDLPDRERLLGDFPVEVRRLGEAMLERVDPEIVVCDRSRVQAASPPSPSKTFVSPSALMLALAAQKPEMSLVRNIDRARSLLLRFEDDASSRDPEIMRVRSAMEAAQRAIERRRWVEWYCRTFYEENET